MSGRAMEMPKQFSPGAEAYVLMKHFASSGYPPQLELDYAHASKKAFGCLRKYTGIPTSIGVAETKTLAKVIANLLCCKKNAELDK